MPGDNSGYDSLHNWVNPEELLQTILKDFKLDNPGNLQAVQGKEVEVVSILKILAQNAPSLIHQNNFNALINHPNLLMLKQVFLELLEANLSIDKNFDKLMQVNKKDLDWLHLFCKQKNVFYPKKLSQSLLNQCISAIPRLSALQLLRQFTDHLYLFPRRDMRENLGILTSYEKYFVSLSEVINQLGTNDLCQGLDTLLFELRQSSKKIELLVLVGEYINDELLEVIRMRQNIASSKGNSLIVIPYEAYESLMQVSTLDHVSKLSFLHHSGEEARWMAPERVDYPDKIAEFAQKMPQLKEIVLRGCKGVSEYSYKKESKKNLSPAVFTLKLLQPNQNIHAIQTKPGKLLILQKMEDDQLITYVKYQLSNESQAKIQKITNIKSFHVSSFSKAELDIISTHCEGIILSNPTSNKKAPATHLAATFFDFKPMSPEDIRKVKESKLRARTVDQKDFNEKPSYAETIRKNLYHAQCVGISVKAYVGGYNSYCNRVIPVFGHGNKKYPKAIRVLVQDNKEEFKEEIKEEFKKEFKESSHVSAHFIPNPRKNTLPYEQKYFPDAVFPFIKTFFDFIHKEVPNIQHRTRIKKAAMELFGADFNDPVATETATKRFMRTVYEVRDSLSTKVYQNFKTFCTYLIHSLKGAYQCAKVGLAMGLMIGVVAGSFAVPLLGQVACVLGGAILGFIIGFAFGLYKASKTHKNYEGNFFKKTQEFISGCENRALSPITVH